MTSGKKGVILANLGGPTTLDDVRPFLKNLFSDPDIFRLPFGKTGQRVFSSLISTFRSPKSKKYYSAIGGGSPIHHNTLNQAKKLEKALENDGEFRVYAAHRYWHPFLAEIVPSIREDGCEEIVLLPLFPHYSTTTTLSIINEWKRVAGDLPEPRIIMRFYREEGYLNACVEKMAAVLDRFQVVPHLLFSAHSIPLSRVMKGDPYEREVTENVELIMDRLGRDYPYSLCYQSKVGPIKWLSPSFETAIDDLVGKDVRHVLVFPVSFVSEHVETLYELDIQKREYAEGRGVVQYERASTVQDSDEFIHTLRRLVLGSLN
ncbi:MAG: ferrochelatase [Fidelibacterota bacterium]